MVIATGNPPYQLPLSGINRLTAPIYWLLHISQHVVDYLWCNDIWTQYWPVQFINHTPSAQNKSTHWKTDLDLSLKIPSEQYSTTPSWSTESQFIVKDSTNRWLTAVICPCIMTADKHQIIYVSVTWRSAERGVDARMCVCGGGGGGLMGLLEVLRSCIRL